jgi:hypothetical protein
MTDHIAVQLLPPHPHAGEHGRITIVDGKVTLIAPLGLGKPDMVLVELDDCRHGETGCYATKKQMRLLKVPA